VAVGTSVTRRAACKKEAGPVGPRHPVDPARQIEPPDTPFEAIELRRPPGKRAALATSLPAKGQMYNIVGAKYRRR
jgi:hypothetical protein